MIIGDHSPCDSHERPKNSNVEQDSTIFRHFEVEKGIRIYQGKEDEN